MKRDSFVLYARHLKNLDKLTDEQAGRLFKAIYQHSQERDVLEIDGVTDMLLGIITDQMDEDAEKYNSVIEKRARAGRASAEARANKKEKELAQSTHVESVEQKATNDNTNEQTPTNATDNVNDNDNVNVNDNDKNISTEKVVSKKSLYGEYKHVRLTGAQYEDAVRKYGKGETDYLIQEVDSYCERTGKRYKNYREAINTFVNNGALEKYKKSSNNASGMSDLFGAILKNRNEKKGAV